MSTLYKKLTQVENAQSSLAKVREFVEAQFGPYVAENIELHVPSQESIVRAQRALFDQYADNDVLRDATQGRITVVKSLEKLTEVNKGIRRILPRKRDEIHNERVKNMGALVGELKQIRSRGIYFPDNLVTGFTYGAAATYAFIEFVAKPLFIMAGITESEINNEPGLIRNFSLTLGSMGGIFSQLARIDGGSKVNAAQYLDQKIAELDLRK